MRWEHIQMSLQAVNSNVEHTDEYLYSRLIVDVAIHYAKGKTHVANAPIHRLLQPLSDAQFAHADPLAYLLVSTIWSDQNPQHTSITG